MPRWRSISMQITWVGKGKISWNVQWPFSGGDSVHDILLYKSIWFIGYWQTSGFIIIDLDTNKKTHTLHVIKAWSLQDFQDMLSDRQDKDHSHLYGSDANRNDISGSHKYMERSSGHPSPGVPYTVGTRPYPHLSLELTFSKGSYIR